MQRLILTFAGGLSILAFAVPSSQPASCKEASMSAQAHQNSTLLEIGAAPRDPPVRLATRDFKLVSYNIRWRSGDELRKLAHILKEDPEIGGAAVLGLQEVDRNKKRSGNKNTAEFLARELGMYYAWAAPPPPPGAKEEETGVVLLSDYPLTDVRRLILPHEGPGGRRRVALGATVKLAQVNVRIYSVHSETRIPVGCKLEQMRAVIDDLASYDKSMPAVILGDLNTREPEAVTKTFNLFNAEHFQTPFDDQFTFFRRALFIPIELKLDWIWLRNLESTSHGIDRAIKLSDHWPLWLVFRAPGRAVESAGMH